MRQASPDAGNLRLFSLLVAWPSFPEAAVSLGFFSHHGLCCLPGGMSPGNSLDLLLACGSRSSPGDMFPGAAVDIRSGCGSCCLPGNIPPGGSRYIPGSSNSGHTVGLSLPGPPLQPTGQVGRFPE